MVNKKQNELSLKNSDYALQIKHSTEQLGIVSSFIEDIASKRLVSLLKRIPAEDASILLSANAPIDEKLLDMYCNNWAWSEHNKEPSWWEAEYINLHVSDELESNLYEFYESFIIDRKNYLDIEDFSNYKLQKNCLNPKLAWTIPIIENYKKRWNWWGLSINQSLPWTVGLIKKHQDKWDWKALSANTSLPWSFDLLEYLEDFWEWLYIAAKILFEKLAPIFSISDTHEVMRHHFGERSSHY